MILMPIIYKNNAQLITEIKKLMLEQNITQKEVAEKLRIKPQGFTKLINKKNFSFDDAQKILSVMDYNLTFDFSHK